MSNSLESVKNPYRFVVMRLREVIKHVLECRIPSQQKSSQDVIRGTP